MEEIIVGVNDLATTHPEIAAQWDYSKNGDLTPQMISRDCNEKVWWIMPYDDPETGKHFDFSWDATVLSRATNNSGCPYLSGHKVWTGFNDLASANPQLIKQWHPFKNLPLIPNNITARSTRKVWWYLPYDDPKTGKHFTFEWESTIYDRHVCGFGCPYLSNQELYPGFNDLATVCPELIKELHPTKNQNLDPRYISAHSKIKLWWYLPYDDPKTGKHFDFEWKASVTNRVKGEGCPYLTGHKLYQGFNDFYTTNHDLAQQWNYLKNGNTTPQKLTFGSTFEAYWNCPCGNIFKRSLSGMRNSNFCPSCAAIESKGVKKIKYALKKRGIECTHEKKYDGLRGIRSLRFDFCLSENNNMVNWFREMLIEFDGQQHFKPALWERIKDIILQRQKAFENLLLRHAYDVKKNKFCEENLIPLLRIRYDQEGIIEELIDDFLERPEWYIEHHNKYLDTDAKYYAPFYKSTEKYNKNVSFTPQMV